MIIVVIDISFYVICKIWFKMGSIFGCMDGGEQMVAVGRVYPVGIVLLGQQHAKCLAFF